jgi:hypothetical protein
VGASKRPQGTLTLHDGQMSECLEGGATREILTYLALKVGGDTENPPHPLIQLGDGMSEQQFEWKKIHARANERKAKVQDLITSYKIPCAICGEDHPAVLDFHHVDESAKSFSMNTATKNGTKFERIIEEIDKCVVLCSNCHRKHHNAHLYKKVD